MATKSLDDIDWVAIARAELSRLWGVLPGAELPPEVVAWGPARRVNVTLRRRGAVRGSMSGFGSTVVDQVRDAVTRTALDTRFGGPVVSWEVPHLTLEVWIQTDATFLVPEERTNPGVLCLGIDGVEVRQGSAHAYYKPSVAITSRFTSPSELFRGVCKKAGLPPNAWKEQACQLHKTRWKHFSEGPESSNVRLRAFKRVEPADPGAIGCRSWVEQGADYLLRNQTSDGRYAYLYDPLSGREEIKDIHVVRSAGCVYAMSLAASQPWPGAVEAWRQSAARAAFALLSRATPFGGGLVVREQNTKGKPWGKLGSIALLAMALSFPALHSTFKREHGQLVSSIKEAQSEDGTFRCVLGSDTRTARGQDFYPGQALLGLALASDLGDQSAISHCRAAFVPYREHFRKAPKTAFILWQVDAWRRLAAAEKNPTFANFAFELVDWLLQFQLPDSADAQHRGGFSAGRPPDATSCVYAEAVIRGATLASVFGEVERRERYRNAALRGLRFCNQLTLGPLQRPFLASPERAYGGVTESLSDFRVRCDRVQHLITLGLAALEDPELLATN